MLLKPALLLPGLYMLYMLSLPPGYRGLLYTGLKGGGARVVLVIGGIGGPEVRIVLSGCINGFIAEFIAVSIFYCLFQYTMEASTNLS